MFLNKFKRLLLKDMQLSKKLKGMINVTEASIQQPPSSQGTTTRSGPN